MTEQERDPTRAGDGAAHPRGWPRIGVLEDDIWRWKERAEQAERELAEARAREQRLREALEHVLPYVEHGGYNNGELADQIKDVLSAEVNVRGEVFTDTDLREGAAQAGAQGPWLPIETAPKDGTWIVAVGRLRHEPRNWRACLTHWSSGFAPPVYAEGWSFSAPGYSDLFDPVYWLPQPQPPSPTPSPADQEGR